jgi:hypothetical protein
MPQDEWEQLRATLRARGVAGAEDLGTFVGNTEHFAPSELDERSAMPVFLEALPALSDRGLVGAVAGHLRRPWARPAAFKPLHAAFLRWAPIDPLTGWALGDALATSATANDLEDLLAICTNEQFGMARQMVVDSLRRYKKAPSVTTTLTSLMHDPDVGLHAMSALRAVIGNASAIPLLERVSADYAETALGASADRQLRKAHKALAGS